MSEYIHQNPKVVRYASVMAACCCLNFLLYNVATLIGLPVWLDTTGTAPAA